MSSPAPRGMGLARECGIRTGPGAGLSGKAGRASGGGVLWRVRRRECLGPSGGGHWFQSEKAGKGGGRPVWAGRGRPEIGGTEQVQALADPQGRRPEKRGGWRDHSSVIRADRKGPRVE